jgi:hypothetical protein
LAEAMPYLYEAKATAVVVDEEHPAELQALTGLDAANHLQHHGIDAMLHRVRSRTHDVAAALIEEAERLEVDLMVMGGWPFPAARDVARRGHLRPVASGASAARHCALAAGGNMRESFHVAYQSGRAMGQNAAAAVACCSTTSRRWRGQPPRMLSDQFRCLVFEHFDGVFEL